MFQILRTFSNVKFVKLYTNEKRLRWPLRSIRFFTYKHECGEHSLVYKTIGELLDESAEIYPERTAYVSVYQKRRISFKQLKEKSEKLAAGLLGHGIEKGDRVGVWAPNSLEWYITNFAVAKAGGISVYLNPAYQANEIKHCLTKVGVKMLIMAESFKSQNYPKILDEIAPEVAKSEPGKFQCKQVPSLKKVICFSENKIPGTLPFEAIYEGANDATTKKLQDIQKLMNADDASNIQFTSGTTGSPKGAVLSHFHIVNNSRFIAHRLNLFSKKHAMCFMGPLFHAMGSVIGVLTCLHAGTTLVIPKGAYNSKEAVMAIMEEKCTVLLGTPTMYIDILKYIQENNLKLTTPEVAITGGAYAPVQLFNDMLTSLGVQRVASVYGLTETGPVSFMSTVNDNKEQMTTTVGYIMDFTEAKVVDHNGCQVPWDQPGELWVRGYNVMKGYWNDEKKTKDTITEDNWLKTGDQFSISKDGYGKVVGRIKDLIIRGGENIYPADIEEFLTSHADILDVQVVGVPDKRLGEKVCACVRLKPNSKLSAENIKSFCVGKIAGFKIPEYIYFTDQFPKTSSGKVQKFKLVQEAVEFFKLKEGQ